MGISGGHEPDRRFDTPLSRRRSAIDAFANLYYDSLVWQNTWWLGVQTHKCPLDLWIYQELLYANHPDVVVETGVWMGGSSLFLACLCDYLQHGRLISVDLELQPARAHHPRITYVEGSSIAAETIAQVRNLINPGETVMVILDSDHAAGHVRQELELYAPLVTSGQYLVVEDTNVNGHPVSPDFGPGPMEAVVDFMSNNQDFDVDTGQQKFFLTFNPRGYLRRR